MSALNKKDDSGAAELLETSAEELDVVEASEVDMGEEKDAKEASVLKDEGISDHFTSEKAAAPSGGL